MENIKRVLSYTRRAVDDYEMIREGDKIAVGVSAGKDSLTLLCALASLKRFYPKKFELCAITVDMGFEGSDFSPIAKLCEELEVPYTVVPTEIQKIIFEVRKEKKSLLTLRKDAPRRSAHGGEGAWVQHSCPWASF